MPNVRLTRLLLSQHRPEPEAEPHPVVLVVGLVAALGAVWLGVCVALGMA